MRFEGLRPGAGRRLAAAVPLGLLASSLAAAPALAQVVLPPSVSPFTPAAPAVPGAGVQVDPGRVFGDDNPLAIGLDVVAALGLNISAALNTEWSDNFARQEEGLPLRNGLESRSDWRFTPSVSVSAGRALGRQQVFVNASLGRDFYARNTLLDKNRLAVNGGFAWTLGTRCGGRLQGGWSKRGTQFAVFEDVVPSTQERSNFLASASCRTSTGLSVNASYDRYNTRSRTSPEAGVDAPDRSFSNVNGQGLTGGIGYTLSSRGEFGVSGNWRKLDFPNQFISPSESNGSTITGANVYGNYRVGPSLRVNGSVGFSKVNPKAPGAADFKGTVWNIGLNYTGPRLGAGLSTGRSVNGSTGGSANYRVNKFFNANVTYRANDRLSASTGYARGNSENRGLSLIPETEIINDSKTDRFFVGADYRFNRILAFSLDYNHQRRRAEPSGFNYKANSVQFGIRANF